MFRTIASRLAAGLVALAVLPALPLPAGAQDFQKGLDAANRRDYAVALREWRPLAEQGNAVAQGSLGSLYALGLGVPVDVAEALKWYRRAAAQGLEAAQFNLGQLLRNRNAGEYRDHGEAMKWYGKAADQGNAEAHYKLGLMHANGEGGPQDFAAAHMHWTIAEALGFSDAARQLDSLGKLMPAGQIAEAERRALAWLEAHDADSRMAAQLRHELAARADEIGRLRETLATREAEAATLRRQIAELDSTIADLRVEAADRLAAVAAARRNAAAPETATPPAATPPAATPKTSPATVAEGIDAYQAGDFARAFDIWQRLAKAGDTRAQFHLGALYHEGRGVARDADEARHWLGVAARNGSNRAATMLESLD